METELSNGSVSAWAGRADDPFFFDLDGFVATLGTLANDADGPDDLRFASLLDGTAVDSLAGSNAMAIVLEFPVADATDAFDYVHMWATTGGRP